MLGKLQFFVLAAALALGAQAAEPMAKGLKFSTYGDDCWMDAGGTNAVAAGECYALVWKQDGATFTGLPAVPPNPNDPYALGEEVWLVDYFPVAELDEATGRMRCPEQTIGIGKLPAWEAQNGTWTIYLLDTRYRQADGTIACGFDTAVTNAPRRINAYCAVPGLTDFTIGMTLGPAWETKIGGNADGTPVVADVSTGGTTFVITFDAAGGTSDETRRIMWKDEKVGKLPTATRRGYAFVGWFTAPEDGEPVSADTFVKTDVTYYAQWTANEYTVDFDPRGGTGTMEPQAMTWDEEEALISNLYARVGYTFLGWTDDETELEEVLYYDGVVVSNLTDEAGGEYDLYAVWAANSYTVSFDANGGVGDRIDDLECFYGTEYQLPKNCFSREGYGFAGWTNATSVAVYADGSSVSNLTAEAGGKVVMFATWQAGSNTVNFDANGGKGLEVLSRSVKTGEKLGELPTPVLGNYAFAGWFTEREGGDLVTADTVVTADMTIFAHWTPIVYTITYNLDGGVNAAENPTSYTVETPDITLAAPTRKDYVFAGWLPSGLIAKGSTGEKVLTAQWTPIVYTITYNLDGGVNAAENPASYTVETPDITLAAPTRKGFVFQGWEPAGVIAKGTTGNLTFTAKWEATLFDEPTVGPISEKGATYNGFLGDEEFGGTFTLVVKKLKKGQTFADATLTRVNPATGKKEKVIGKVDAATGEGAEGLAGLQLNVQGVGGTLGGFPVQGAVDAAKAKDADALAVMKGFDKRVYGLVFEDSAQETAYLTVAFSTKGKAKVAGSYRGAKVSGSAQMSVGNECCAVPFAWSKKGVSVSFVLWFDAAGSLIDVTGLGPGKELRAAGSAEPLAARYAFVLDPDAVSLSVADPIPELFNPLLVPFDGKKFDAGKAAKVSYKKGELSVLGDNVTGLKLTYSKGALKGSFTVYAVTNGKLVKNKFTVSGVMVDGEIHAVGTNKKLTPIPVVMKK